MAFLALVFIVHGPEGDPSPGGFMGHLPLVKFSLGYSKRGRLNKITFWQIYVISRIVSKEGQAMSKNA